jgi:hypothetical protein
VLGASEPIPISDLISLGLCNALLFERDLADSEERFGSAHMALAAALNGGGGMQQRQPSHCAKT